MTILDLYFIAISNGFLEISDKLQLLNETIIHRYKMIIDSKSKSL